MRLPLAGMCGYCSSQGKPGAIKQEQLGRQWPVKRDSRSACNVRKTGGLPETGWGGGGGGVVLYLCVRGRGNCRGRINCKGGNTRFAGKGKGGESLSRGKNG